MAVKTKRVSNAQALRDALASIKFDGEGPVVSLWADGGVIRINPSPHGGTYAWCGVNVAGEVVIKGSSVVPAPPGKQVTNNDTEIMAVIKALEAVPEGWKGTVYTDSQVTIKRFQFIRNNEEHKIKRIPTNVLNAAIAAYERVGKIEFRLVKGHPDAASLEIGHYEKDVVEARMYPRIVSMYNVWCDEECGQLAKEWWATRESAKKTA